MLAQTCREAANRIGAVDVLRVFNPRPLYLHGSAAALLTISVALFAILIPSFAFHPITAGNDVPFGLSTEPALKGQLPASFVDSDTADFVVEVVVDGQGRMADFAIVQGPSLAQNPGLKRLIESKLLFTQFTPATAFGRPTPGKMYLSFQRQLINIRS